MPQLPSESDAEREERAARTSASRARALLDRVLSASAGLVALSALCVSAYQTYIMRQQLKAGAWPYVLQQNTGGPTNYAWQVKNLGLGPALVRSMTVRVDGRPVHNWREFVTAAERLDSAGAEAWREQRVTTMVTSSIRPGTVLLAGSTTELIRVTGTVGVDLRRLLNDDRVRVRVCYCSLYDDCWASESKDPAPAGLDACTSDPAAEFRS